MKLSSILLLAVVLIFFVQNKSLTAIGIPGNFKSKFGFQSRGFPTIVKLEKANGKLNLVEFEGERTVDGLTSFC